MYNRKFPKSDYFMTVVFGLGKAQTGKGHALAQPHHLPINIIHGGFD